MDNVDDVRNIIVFVIVYLDINVVISLQAIIFVSFSSNCLH